MIESNLVIDLVKHVGLIVAGAFILLTLSPVQQMNLKSDAPRHRVFLILFFGMFGILGTYSSDTIFTSFANLRAMAVITAGLYAGPLVGLGAGLISGGHRFLIDPWGFSTVACTMATILEGIASGLIQRRMKGHPMNWKLAMIIGVVGECLHMILVLSLSKPYDQALDLVRVIALPMIIGNSFGAALFTHLIRTLMEHNEKRDSTYARNIFHIAGKTVSHLRDGLNITSAQATAEIIYQRLSVAAVAVTDGSRVLAHVGHGDDHHLPGKELRTKATRKVLDTGTSIFHKKRSQIGCNHPDCPFCSAIILPLKKSGEIVGTLKFYGTEEIPLDRIKFEIARGLTDLFSIQLELEDIQVKQRLLAHAEIRHLQAQINPHFLFNSLNTIASFCRTAPVKARELILDLSLYMRKNLDSSRGFIRLSDELSQIRSYLAIEKARFGDRLCMEIDVSEGCEEWPIPSLLIQPLVENSIKHGIGGREEGGKVTLNICEEKGLLCVSLKDDGVGIPGRRIESFFHKSRIESGNEGIGLRNCNHRLEQIYGPGFRMKIQSRLDEGTCINFKIPRPDGI